MRAWYGQLGRAVVVLGVMCVPASVARAQETAARPTAAVGGGEKLPEMVTDRPDVTESSEVVGRGIFQFESGWTYEADGAARSQTMPAGLLRLGLSRRLELRLGGDGFLLQTDGTVRQAGHSDFEIGAKVRVFDESAAGFDMAVIPMFSVPTGSAGFTSGGYDPTLKLTLARSLPAGFHLSGNVNVSSVSDELGRFAQRALTLSAGHDLVAGWGGFLEVYGFSPIERGAQSGVTIDGGASHFIGGNLQFDVEAGRGVNADAPDWFAGFGFAVRGRLLGRR